MKFPVRFVTIAICATFVMCAVLRNVTPLVSRVVDMRTLEAIHAIQENMKRPSQYKFNL